MQLIITNRSASFAETLPAGMSRMSVRGFFASIFLSRYLLKAIAAFRAKTIHKITAASKYQVDGIVCSRYA